MNDTVRAIMGLSKDHKSFKEILLDPMIKIMDIYNISFKSDTKSIEDKFDSLSIDNDILRNQIDAIKEEMKSLKKNLTTKIKK